MTETVRNWQRYAETQFRRLRIAAAASEPGAITGWLGVIPGLRPSCCPPARTVRALNDVKHFLYFHD